MWKRYRFRFHLSFRFVVQELVAIPPTKTEAVNRFHIPTEFSLRSYEICDEHIFFEHGSDEDPALSLQPISRHVQLFQFGVCLSKKKDP